MSRLADQVPAGTPPAPAATGPMTPERALAILVMVALGFLVFARHYFRQFIPR